MGLDRAVAGEKRDVEKVVDASQVLKSDAQVWGVVVPLQAEAAGFVVENGIRTHVARLDWLALEEMEILDQIRLGETVGVTWLNQQNRKKP